MPISQNYPGFLSRANANFTESYPHSKQQTAVSTPLHYCRPKASRLHSITDTLSSLLVIYITKYLKADFSALTLSWSPRACVGNDTVGAHTQNAVSVFGGDNLTGHDSATVLPIPLH